MTKKVLVAHQSTIPHYRARFYELIEEMRPPEWEFRVVFDPDSDGKSVSHQQTPANIRFPIHQARTRSLPLGGHSLIWQSFLSEARRSDLLVTDSHIANLSYPAASLLRRSSTPHVIWGHPFDRNQARKSLPKKIAETCKQTFFRRVDGFFAYTEEDAGHAHAMGIPRDRVFTLQNTIDIRSNRDLFNQFAPKREELRRNRHISDRRVILSVGRLVPGKQTAFLCDLFRRLKEISPVYHLVTVGGGPEMLHLEKLKQDVAPQDLTVTGPVTGGERLAEWYTVADLYVIPGDVGLAPLQAISYDLPVIARDLPTHGPEIAWLNPRNSIILPSHLTPEQAAESIHSQWSHLVGQSFREQLYPSISHLTLENMASRFVDGVTAMLQLGRRK